MNAPKAPKHLSRASRAFWNQITADYTLESHHFRLLQRALEAWDRKEQAREQLAADGPIYNDRFGAPHKHPSVSIEETARIQFIRAMRELDLEGEPAPDPRPARRK